MSKMTSTLLVLLSACACFGQDEPKPEPNEARKVLDQSIDAIAKHTSIQANMLETVQMGTREFVASGTYAQTNSNQLRMELEIQPIKELAIRKTKDGEKRPPKAAKTTTPKRNAVLQISDGRMLWTQWTIDGRGSVERRDLDEIKKAVGSKGPWTPDELLADMGLGGVPALLRSLRKRMVFAGTREEQIDGKPFIVIQGSWTPEQIARFMAPEQPQPDPILRPHLPEYVRVYFEKKTLFPRRILYLKRHPDPKQRVARPIVTLDFTKVVLNGEVAADQFSFGGNAKSQIDRTDDIIANLKSQLKMFNAAKQKQQQQNTKAKQPL